MSNTSLIASDTTYKNLTHLSKRIASSGFFPDVKSEDVALTKAIAGLELGLSAVASQTAFHIIQQKPCLTAGAMASLIRISNKYDYRIRKHDLEICELEAFIYPNGKQDFEKRESLGIVSFSIQDAERAKLFGQKSQNWEKYPRDLMFARAISRMIKWHMPDLTMTPIYTPEELGATVDAEGNIINAAYQEINDYEEREVQRQQAIENEISKKVAELKRLLTEEEMSKVIDYIKEVKQDDYEIANIVYNKLPKRDRDRIADFAKSTTKSTQTEKTDEDLQANSSLDQQSNSQGEKNG